METTKRYSVMIRALWLLLALLLSPLAATLHAETAVGGAIATDTAWQAADGPFLVTADLVVDSGATLTIGPGVTVRFQAGKRLVVKNGSLRVSGTAASMVLFTSWRDVTAGTPAAGDWGGLEFQDGTADATTLLEHAVINFGSTTLIRSASPTFNSCRFMNNNGFALDVDLFSFPHGAGNIASGNGRDAIRVPAGEMTASGAWDLTGIPYFLDGEVSVGAAPTISGITPQDLEQGSSVSATITGTRLSGAKSVTFSAPGVSATIQPGGTATSLPLQITVTAAAPLGSRTFTATVAAGEVSSQTGVNVVPPVPLITSITPDRLYVNRPAANIDITGKNFTGDSVVYLDGAALATTFVSATALTAAVPTQQTARTAQLQVKYPDPRPAGSFINSNTASLTVELPPLAFSPATATVRQGETSSTLNLTIPFAAPVGGMTANLLSTKPEAATVAATITIPEGATSVAVPLTALSTGSNHEVSLDVTASQANWLVATAAVTVKPQPTANLAPTSILTGQSFSVFLTVNLTDPAPAGGLTIALEATPAGVVDLPASLTIPAGASSGQLTMIASTPGNATITATPAAGKGFYSGDLCQVSVKPIQTYNIGPMTSLPVGVVVETTPPQKSAEVSYKALASKAVGVLLGSAITSITPDWSSIGSTGITVRVNGYGLSNVDSVSFGPADGITVSGPLVVAPDGLSVQFAVDILSTASPGERVVTLKSGGTTIIPAAPGANIFNVTWPPPQLWSLLPNYGITGTTATLSVNGRYLQEAVAITVEPPDGIIVGNPPVVNASGTLASVPVVIDSSAATGVRVVRITTRSGTTSAVMAPANSFDIRTTPGSTYPHIVSPQVGVTVDHTATQEVSRDYKPITSLPVGIVVGPVITGIQPASGAIGTSGLALKITGRGLDTATAVSFQPPEGISVTAFTPAADGTYLDLQVDIAADAPTTMRTYMVAVPGGFASPAAAGANRFRVTLPLPEILGIKPIRREVGSTFTLTVLGKNLSAASSVNFNPPDGLVLGNPPTVNSDGNLATVTVTVAADAPVGDRVVTLSTPGGTTSAVKSLANTFTLTALPGTDYLPLVSGSVGVVKEIATVKPPVVTNIAILSPQIGVTLTPPPPGEIQVPYAPVVSGSVGVALGPTFTGSTPGSIELGTTVTVTVTGTGLEAVTSAALYPNTGTTVGTVSVAPDGKSLSFPVTVDQASPRGGSAIILTTPAGVIYPSVPRAGVIMIGPRPSINSIVPITQTVGTSFTLTIHGKDLQGATAVSFSPPDGVFVLNPPAVTVDATGEHATVSVVIDGLATKGSRAVIITTPYGSSDATATERNTFTISNPSARLVPLEAEPTVRVAAVERIDSTAPVSISREYLSLCGIERCGGRPRIEPRYLHDIAAHSIDTDARCIACPWIETSPWRPDGREYRIAGYRAPPAAKRGKNS